MDIGDILASVDDDSGLPAETQDLLALTRGWVTEHSAPELLPWPAPLMERVLDRLRKQIEIVEEQAGNSDPKTNLRLIITQTELERYKYLIRSFVRIRLAKIDAFPAHYLAAPEANSLLSASEREYLSAHTTLLHEHYNSSFLGQFPPALQKMDDRAAGGISMVEVPDQDKAVFVRALKDMDDAIQVPGTEINLVLGKGEIVVTRWSTVREMVLKGECELV